MKYMVLYIIYTIYWLIHLILWVVANIVNISWQFKSVKYESIYEFMNDLMDNLDLTYGDNYVIKIYNKDGSFSHRQIMRPSNPFIHIYLLFKVGISGEFEE